MLHAAWTARSLRYWIALGMTIAVAPLALSAIAGYVLLDRGVIASFQDVAVRHRDQIVPTQHLRLLIWDTLIPVDEFVDEGDPRLPPAYRSLRGRIESAFAVVHEHMGHDPGALALVERAREDWTAADDLATELISVRRAPGDPHGAELMERFHGKIAATADTLGAVYDTILGELRRDHDVAIRFYERSLWLAGLAAAASLLAMACGVFLVGRIMSASVDRLVDGAARFADGDREHRIVIRIPPELRRVADEFNRMIERIHDSESALSNLARRDSLTGLLNRRAFDEALTEACARMKRTDAQGALLSLDIDHFKRVNDTYGHAAGDDLLRAMAELVSAELRPYDRVFRVGGEEFAVLLPECSMEMAQETAERLRRAVEGRVFRVGDAEINATVSIGAAKASQALSPAALTEAADAALYRAKTGGRNRVVIIDEFGMHEAGIEPAAAGDKKIVNL